jgi:hypothetical protein
MATEKQRRANQKNGKRSKGPSSEAGKAVSRMSAYKHGLTARTLVIGDEDPADFERLLTNLRDDFNPQDGISHELVFQLATQLWRVQRIPALEAGIMRALRSETSTGLNKDTEAARREDLEKIAARFLPKKTEDSMVAAKPKPALPGPPADKDEGRITGFALIKDSKESDALGRLSHYESALMNGITRTLRMLHFVQTRDTAIVEARVQNTSSDVAPR